MASVFQRGSRWYVRVKDSTGRWINRVTTATTKTEARRLAGDVERKAERVRFGLEAAPPVDGGGTLGDLLSWWLDTYRKGQPAYATEECGVRVHIQLSALASLPLVQVTPGQIEELLQRKAGDGLSAESLNHLRGYIGRAFSKARKAGRWHGTNPVLDVGRRRVNRKTPDYLRPDEVRGVLDNLPERWRPAFAVAIYCGLRFGEVAGLRKTDVDFGEDPHLTVRRSWARDTTKGGRARVIPVPAECVPFLCAAAAASSSDLLFPGEGGKMLGRGKRLTPMLRRAMARAGLVTGYVHKCRRPGCQHAVAAPDRALRRCPSHAARLWPVPQVRPVQFKATRATCASVLIQLGASPAAVATVLGHADVKTTMEHYAALSPGFMRSEVERLRFGFPVEAPVRVAAGAEAGPFAAPLLHGEGGDVKKAGTPGQDPQDVPAFGVARDTGFEPVALSSGG